MQFVGIDLSLTSTGLAVGAEDEAIITRVIKSKPLPGKDGYLAKLDRFQRIRSEIMLRLGNYDRTYVYLEGPSYGSAGQATHDIAGNWWLLYESLIDWDFQVVVVPPATVKTYATGKGNAGKDAVLAAAIKRYPTIDIPGNDIADAVVLLAIARRHAGCPLEYSLPATHLRAMDKLVKP